jgi:ABC-type Fe3+/spermidine/putrescine transport system ATPase subunit
LRTILHRTNIPAIYVTHDQEEAFTIADRVLILHEGKIVRDGTPSDVWAKPESAFVAGFLGLGNLLNGEVVEQNKFQTAHGVFTVNCTHKHSKGNKVHVLARPLPAKDEANFISGLVVDVIFQQDRFKVTFDNGLYVYLDEAPKSAQKISVPVKVECLA